jgi:glycosyltransferase involved in cell wall biosynthesis
MVAGGRQSHHLKFTDVYNSKMSSGTKPFVSIVTPTYNRRAFIPQCVAGIRAQTYPLDRIEWLVYDDGTDKISDLLAPDSSLIAGLRVRYFSSDTKVNIGAKRNFLNDQAAGEIIVTMDDDDYYAPERVQHAVQTLISACRPSPSKSLRECEDGICGSSRNFMYFADDASIWETGPYGARHATFGTMAYTYAFARKHRCDESVTYAEEITFTNSYKVPLVQLDPYKVMVVICHKENTFNKNRLRTDENPFVKKSTMKLRQLIRDAKAREFYSTV